MHVCFFFFRNKKPTSFLRWAVLFSAEVELSYFYVSACFFQLSGDIFSFSFRYTFFYRLRSSVNQLFGFFQTQTGQIFYDLNYVELGSATAFQDHVERGFLFNSGSATFATASYYYCSCSRLDAIL